MLKQLVALIALCVAVILFMLYAQHAIEWILVAQNWVAEILTQVFSGGPAGDIIRKVLALLLIPFAVALVPTLIYWLTRRHWSPYFMNIVWVVWLIQTAAIIIQYKAVA